MSLRGGEVTIPPKNNDVIYKQPLMVLTLYVCCVVLVRVVMLARIMVITHVMVLARVEVLARLLSKPMLRC